MAISPQQPTAPATSNTCGDSDLDLAIQVLVTKFCELDPSGLHLEEDAAGELIELWLQRGRDLRQLLKQLKQQKLPDKWAVAWARDIDYLFAGRTGRGVERDRLHQEVARLVRLLNQQANDPGIYRELVALGCQCGKDGDFELFERYLHQGKLEKSRISEIMRIVESEATAKPFSEGTLSVRRALFLARLTPPKKNQAAIPPAGKAGSTDKGAGAPDEDPETPWDKRLASTIQALLKLVEEELARKVRGPQPKEWRKQVGFCQLSFKPLLIGKAKSR